MNSSVKSLVPSVSEPPEPSAALEDAAVDVELEAAAELELELELEPHAASSTVAMAVNAATSRPRQSPRVVPARDRLVDLSNMRVFPPRGVALRGPSAQQSQSPIQARRSRYPAAAAHDGAAVEA